MHPASSSYILMPTQILPRHPLSGNGPPAWALPCLLPHTVAWEMEVGGIQSSYSDVDLMNFCKISYFESCWGKTCDLFAIFCDVGFDEVWGKSNWSQFNVKERRNLSWTWITKKINNKPSLKFLHQKKKLSVDLSSIGRGESNKKAMLDVSFFQEKCLCESLESRSRPPVLIYNVCLESRR